MSSHVYPSPFPGLPTRRPAPGICPSPIARPALVIVVLVIILSSALVLSGVTPSAAVGTVSGAGLAAMEVMRRLTRATTAGEQP